MNNPAADMRPVKKEPIEKEDEDVPCGELNECMMMDDAQQTDIPSNMQPISRATNGWDSKIDRRYMMLLDSCREDGDSYPRVRDNPLRCIRYDVDNGGYDKRELKLVTVTDKKKRSRVREDRNTVRVTKKNDVHVQASSKKTAKEAADSDLRRRERSVVTGDKSVRAKRNSQEACDKDNTEDQMVVVPPDENYRAWLVGKSKIPRADPEKEIQVKREEEDTMSLPGSDIIAVGDRPFEDEDEEESPFVPSKSYKVTDLEEESDDGDDDQRTSWFRKEITNILKQPYNEKELLELKKEASERRSLTRCRELRDGREIDYATEEKGRSYLDKYPIFKRMLKEALRDKDRHRALNLLRGFIFYLTKVVRHDAFQPWRDRECLKIM